MSGRSEQYRPDDLAATQRPIEFLTENGFSIVRRWELDLSEPSAGGPFHFLVSDPQDLQTEITVEIGDACLETLALQTQARIAESRSFWITCAENHLAEYLWEQDGYPEGNRLVIDCLSPADLLSATRWHRDRTND